MTEERFEELLGSVLEERVGVVPRRGLEGRVLARVGDRPPGRRIRWASGMTWGGALLVGLLMARVAMWMTPVMPGKSVAVETRVRSDAEVTRMNEGAPVPLRADRHAGVKRSRKWARRPDSADGLRLEPLEVARLRVEAVGVEELRIERLDGTEKQADER